LQTIILRGAAPLKGRPSASLPPADSQRKGRSRKEEGHPVSNDDLLSYLLYPEVFSKYDKFNNIF